MATVQQINEKMKCLIATEVKNAIENKNATINNSSCSDYLKETLQTNDPFNRYYDKYSGDVKTRRIQTIIILALIALSVLIPFVWSSYDSSFLFAQSVKELLIITTLGWGIVNAVIISQKRRKAINYYAPILGHNLKELENELKLSTLSSDRRTYIASLNYLCEYIYARDKYFIRKFK